MSFDPFSKDSEEGMMKTNDCVDAGGTVNNVLFHNR
jgi:hypothetical protein